MGGKFCGPGRKASGCQRNRETSASFSAPYRGWQAATHNMFSQFFDARNGYIFARYLRPVQKEIGSGPCFHKATSDSPRECDKTARFTGRDCKDQMLVLGLCFFTTFHCNMPRTHQIPLTEVTPEHPRAYFTNLNIVDLQSE